MLKFGVAPAAVSKLWGDVGKVEVAIMGAAGVFMVTVAGVLVDEPVLDELDEVDCPVEEEACEDGVLPPPDEHAASANIPANAACREIL